MRVILSLFVLSLLLPSTATAQETERAVLKMSIGDSLVVVDSLVRTDVRLVSRVTNFHRARFLIEADLRDDESIDRVHVVVWPWDRTTDDEPAVDVLVKPVGEVLMRETDDGLAVVREIEAGTLPSVSPSLALVEQQIRHARRRVEGNGSTTIPMWTPYGGDGKGRTWTDTVTFVAPDSVEISGWEDTVSSYRIDQESRILSGRMGPVGYVIERTALPED